MAPTGERKRHGFDIPNSNATPKRAKLNRLKLQQSADISLSVIESDDENSDPNRNPANAMDVSY